MYEIVCANRTFYIPRNKEEEKALPQPPDGEFATPSDFEWKGDVFNILEGYCYRGEKQILKINSDGMREVMESVDIPNEGLDVVARITTPTGTVFQRYPVKEIGNRLTFWGDFVRGTCGL
ncbi:hypothetical protein KY339_06080 [Candidatus Woesearchaeota archaeon]|nr:hypothetical protein [Candidatus Woesearchaeota archaeon]